MRSRGVLANSSIAILWGCFLVRGLFYCASLPVWEGFDEPAHFAYVQYIGLGRGWLVQPATLPSLEVERSVELLPMPWMLRSELPVHETYESYWNLTGNERQHRETELNSLPRYLGLQDSHKFTRIESQQPPLSYWLMAGLYLPLSGLTLPGRVLALRFLNLLLASAAIPAAWLAARDIFAKPAAITLVSVIVLMPELLFDAARVANSGLAIALYSLLAVLVVQVVKGKSRSAPLLGLVLGLGLLTKAFFLTAVPAVALLLGLALWKGCIRLISALAVPALAALISGWWYIRNLLVTHSLSGIVQDVTLQNVSLVERLSHVADVQWLRALDSTFVSHIWFGGWSFLSVRAWIYHSLAVLTMIAVGGLVLAWIKRVPERSHVLAHAILYAFFCAGLAYHVLLTYLANGSSSSAGWYLYAVIVPEAVLATSGLRALASKKTRPYAVCIVAILFAALDIYGMLFVATPYYCGIIKHRPTGHLEAFHWTAISGIGLVELLRRIGANKPAWLGPPALAGSACAYIVTTMIAIFVALNAAWSERSAKA